MKRKLTRDLVLFTAGLALTVNEAVFQHAERPYLLILYAGMMGLPVFTRTDERRRNGHRNGHS